ncbi:hypothetical protein RJ639_003795, partial [Escallonia herrerae]
GSNADKVYFMVLERGPRAFIDCTVQVLRDCLAEGSGIQRLCFSASSHISERITILTSLRFSLATFLAQVYMEVDKLGDKLAKDPENSLPLLLVTVNGLFSKLEASIDHLHAMRQPDSSVDGSYSFPLMFEKLPEVNQEGSQWTECEIRDASNASRVMFKKEHAVNAALLMLDIWNPLVGVIEGIKPECVWIRVVGLPLHIQGDDLWRKIEYRCGGFLWFDENCNKVSKLKKPECYINHDNRNMEERLTGSPDIDNWIREAKESTVNFWSDHVEQPQRQSMAIKVVAVVAWKNFLNRSCDYFCVGDSSTVVAER